MKRYSIVSKIACKVLLFVLAVSFMACEGPTGPMGPAGMDGYDGKDGKDGTGTNWVSKTFTIQPHEWVLGGEPGELNSYFFVDKKLPELTRDIFRERAVIAYIQTPSGYKNGMPYVLHKGGFDDKGKEITWTQTFDFDYSEGWVGFYEKNILHTFDQYIRISGNHNTPPPIPANELQPLLKSLLNKKQITIEYRAAYNFQVTCRTVELQGIFFMSGSWYILAWCTLRNDYRTFHLGRISKVTTCEKHFETTHKPLAELIDDIYHSDDEIKVVIRTHRDAARDMRTMKYTYGLYEETLEEDEEYFLQKFETYSLEKFGRWYLMFADKGEIIEPEELKTVVRNLIGNIKL